MPRKKQEVKTEAETSLPDLTLQATLNAIEGKFGKGSIILAGVNDTVDVERIPFGHPDLDELTNGGVPRGRVTVIIGSESGGKTTLTLTLIASAQRQGYRAAFIDAEHALDPDYAECLGVDLDSLLISQPDSAEQALEIYDMLVKSGAVQIIVLDSVAAMSTQAELEGEMSDQQRGDKAKLMKKALRKLTPPVRKSNVAAVFINQWMDNAGGYGATKEQSAGRGLKHASSLTLDINRKETLYKTKGGDKVPTGQISTVKAIKSKVSVPFRKCEVELNYPARDGNNKLIAGTGGFNIYASIINHALDDGKLVLKGSWYNLADGTRIAQGKDKMIAALQNDEELLEKLK